MSGQTQNIVLDAGGNAAPQAFDVAANAYFYLGGDSARVEAFFRQAPIIPFKIGAYTSSAVVKASAGTFFGALGTYKGAVNAWIMVFDAASAPSAGASPIAQVAVGPISGPDINWNIGPGKPYTCLTGIYIALSTSGAVFTSSGNTDLTGTVEYV